MYCRQFAAASQRQADQPPLSIAPILTLGTDDQMV
jgi:hypothetical protein